MVCKHGELEPEICPQCDREVIDQAERDRVLGSNLRKLYALTQSGDEAAADSFKHCGDTISIDDVGDVRLRLGEWDHYNATFEGERLDAPTIDEAFAALVAKLAAGEGSR